MITCTLGDKKYTVDKITGRALREIQPAQEMYAKILRLTSGVLEGQTPAEQGDNTTIAEALDTLVKWFCVLFGNQFTPDEFYDNYPIDQVMTDIPVALMAVQTATTEVLSDFPMTPTATNKTQA